MALEDAIKDLPDRALVPVRWIREKLKEEPDQEASDELLRVPELADYFDRAESTIRSWLASGTLEGFKLQGREWRVRREDVRRFERRQRSDTRSSMGVRVPKDVSLDRSTEGEA